MPYANMPPEMTAKMDACVQKVMGQGHDKQSAIGICYKSMMGSDPGPETVATLMREMDKPAPASLRAAYFSEPINLRESELDEAEFVAKGVTLIRPGFSTNVDRAGRPRYYAPGVLRQAIGVFEGTRAFRNHPRKTDEKELPERDARDIAGYYTNVRAAEDGRLLGDLRVVGEARQWLWPLIAETKVKPDLVELSINALGQTRLGEAEGRKAVIVESIVGANSVDVVTTGAAGGSFAGAILASDPDGFTAGLLAAMPFEQWREARPDYIDKLKGEWKTARDDAAVKSAQAELAQAKEELARLAEANRALTADLGTYRRAETADRLLTESALPHTLRPTVRTELIEQADEAGMKRVIEREQTKYKAAPKPAVPVNGAGQRPAAPQKDAPPPVNPTVSLWGLNESRMARPGETVTEYMERMRQLEERDI